MKTFEQVRDEVVKKVHPSTTWSKLPVSFKLLLIDKIADAWAKQSFEAARRSGPYSPRVDYTFDSYYEYIHYVTK